ncbi:hypothetical protein [Flavobacterium yafengii]|uniref:hypothetical protein n=1 Tax=Flavobacterium yafengii TaxID=3041253 RepID=UPI0024A85246|nr:hypothetical protein [Flavobacterium yafengii]MDI5899454.1 hypothetical protein [Flavobacterium yafengii]
MKIISYIIVVSILINILVQLGLILRYYYPLIIQYFQNKKITWNSNYDRIIAASFLAFFCLSTYLGRILLTSSNELYLAILYMTILILLTISIYLLQRTGSAERTKSSLFSSIKSDPQNNCTQDFENKYTLAKLEKIFDKLVEYDFIEVLKDNESIIDKNLFVKTLSEGILPKEPIFKLHMDNIQTKEFYKLFKGKFQKLTMSKFLKIFIIKSETATPASISSSKSKNLNGAKKKELIELIFLG